MHSSLTLPDPFPSHVTEDHVGAVSRGRYVVLQALVGVMLGYQLLFGPEPIVKLFPELAAPEPEKVERPGGDFTGDLGHFFKHFFSLDEKRRELIVHWQEVRRFFECGDRCC